MDWPHQLANNGYHVYASTQGCLQLRLAARPLSHWTKSHSLNGEGGKR